jgi:hypothetical protein
MSIRVYLNGEMRELQEAMLIYSTPIHTVTKVPFLAQESLSNAGEVFLTSAVRGILLTSEAR